MSKKKPRQISSTKKPTTPRRLSVPKRSLRSPKTWIIRKPRPTYVPLPKARRLLAASARLIKRDWRTFLGITTVYGLLTLVLVRGLSLGSSNLASLGILDEGLTGFWDKLWSSSVKLATVVSEGAGGAAAPTASLYQIIVFVICSLALVYAFRQLRNKQKVTVRQSFYNGMNQLIPFLLVLIVLSIQLLPIVVAGFLYNALIVQGIAFRWYELWISWALIGLLLFWSLRMLTGSIFALYIVTLPDMTPMRALRSAKKLVWRRRLQIWRKVIPFSVLCSLALVIVMLPVIFWFVGLAPYMVFLFTCVIFTTTHVYMYTLYRELL